jgi:deoxyribodipyrimidine photolyase-related protein
MRKYAEFYGLDYVEFYKLNYRKYASHECYGYTVFDFNVENKLKTEIPNFIWLNSPNFLFTREELLNLTYKRQTPFYIYNRKRLNVLVDKFNNPIGGKWTYDEMNREKLPEDYQPREMRVYESDEFAIKYVKKHFPNNYGECDIMYYPTTRRESLAALKYFLQYNLTNFTYQDAILNNTVDAKLYHSVLSPMLNNGLLTDRDVLQAADYTKYPIESAEGFLRQIVGWRQYMLYIYANNPNIKRQNFMKFTKRISWLNKTGIDFVDNTMEKINKYAYAHHIERLMILGNYLFMKEYKPLDVYKLFMCWTVDAYDWVMASNIFTMSQFSTGPLYTTKPYFSSSVYIVKQSTGYTKNEKFDELYKAFKQKHPELQKFLVRYF